MKKIILFTALLAPLALAGCGETPHEHTFKSEFAYDSTNHWHEASCEHKELTSGLAPHNFGNDNVCDDCGYVKEVPHVHTFEAEWSKDATNHWHAATCGHDVKDSEAPHTFDAAGKCTVCDYQKDLELKITKQPSNSLIKLGEPTSFEVEVSDPSLVKSYQWMLYNVEDPEPTTLYNQEYEIINLGADKWHALDCESARTSKLEIPGPSFYGEKGYKCIITDINDNVIETDLVHYTLDGYKESDPYIQIGTRVLVPGKTLDLADTPFGTGKVTMSEKGDVLTLDNVNFQNTVFDYDPFDADIAFYFMCYQYLEDSFTLKLIGDNKINNTYFEEDARQGGISFGFFFSGRGKQPEISVEGDGNLTIIGGSHAIYANTAIKIASDINMYCIANHWNAGIHGKKITITNSSVIRATLTSYLFESNNKEKGADGTMTIEDNSVIQATIYPVQNSGRGSTLDALSAVTTSHALNIKDSSIAIDLVYDYRNLELGDSLPPTTVIGSNNGDITITNSNISVNAKSLNDEMSMVCYQLDMISPQKDLVVNNSVIKACAECPHIAQIYGVNGKNIYATDSDIFVDIEAYCLNCIASKGIMKFDNSKVDVLGNAYGSEDMSYGVVSYSTYTLENNTSFHVCINEGIAVGVLYGKGVEKIDDVVDPCTYLSIDVTKVTIPSTAGIGHHSVGSVSGGYQYFETVFDSADGLKVATEVSYNYNK